MKYPNSKFTGMSMVTVTTINDAISDYYPNTTQTGGVQRLALLKKATNLDKLIDFCIDGYRAWGDAVLMWAGAYKKIGNYPAEIADAKKYVREEVSTYLKGKPFLLESDYDAWHKKICVNLADNNQYFTGYSAHRKTATKYKNGFTIGNAQKFLNMLMKDLYACLSVEPTFWPGYDEDNLGYEDYFKFCHMPLDSYILKFVDDIRYREKKTHARAFACWSNITDYDDYMKEQEEICDYVIKYKCNPTVTVLQTEFVVWPLYKE